MERKLFSRQRSSGTLSNILGKQSEAWKKGEKHQLNKFVCISCKKKETEACSQ